MYSTCIIFDEYHEFVSDAPIFAGFIKQMRIRNNMINGKTLLLSATPVKLENMWDFKEERRTFTEKQLKELLKRNGFCKIRSEMYLMKNFSIKNWLINSGLDKKAQKKIFDLHVEASPKIKELYKHRQKDERK